MVNALINEMCVDIKHLKDEMSRMNGIITEMNSRSLNLFSLVSESVMKMSKQTNENKEYLMMKMEKGDRETLEASKAYIDNKSNVSKLERISWFIGIVVTLAIGRYTPLLFKSITLFFSSN